MTMPDTDRSQAPTPHLAREMGLLGLISTALCAMIGVGINIIPFMIQRWRPGVADQVPLAYVVAAGPAILAALCYALLSSAMPRAGGSYVYATRALNPFAGFLASFAQWFGLSMGMGVVAYLMVPMLRDIVGTSGWPDVAPVFDRGVMRVPLALAAIWAFWWINRSGIKAYERTVVVMAVAMIVGPVMMTVVGFLHSPPTSTRPWRPGGLPRRQPRRCPRSPSMHSSARPSCSSRRSSASTPSRRPAARPATPARAAAVDRHRHRRGHAVLPCCSRRRCTTRCPGGTSTACRSCRTSRRRPCWRR